MEFTQLLTIQRQKKEKVLCSSVLDENLRFYELILYFYMLLSPNLLSRLVYSLYFYYFMIFCYFCYKGFVYDEVKQGTSACQKKQFSWIICSWADTRGRIDGDYVVINREKEGDMVKYWCWRLWSINKGPGVSIICLYNSLEWSKMSF